MKFFSVAFTLPALLFATTCSQGQHVPQSQLSRYPTLILGKWQSLQDPKSFLVITKKSYQELYEKEHIGALTYELTNVCPDSSVPNPKRKEKDMLVTHDPSDNSFYCYGIDQLTETRLSLIYLGRGNFLRFKRVEAPAAPVQR